MTELATNGQRVPRDHQLIVSDRDKPLSLRAAQETLLNASDNFRGVFTAITKEAKGSTVIEFTDETTVTTADGDCFQNKKTARFVQEA